MIVINNGDTTINIPYSVLDLKNLTANGFIEWERDVNNNIVDSYYQAGLLSNEMQVLFNSVINEAIDTNAYNYEYSNKLFKTSANFTFGQYYEVSEVERRVSIIQNGDFDESDKLKHHRTSRYWIASILLSRNINRATNNVKHLIDKLDLLTYLHQISLFNSEVKRLSDKQEYSIFFGKFDVPQVRLTEDERKHNQKINEQRALISNKINRETGLLSVVSRLANSNLYNATNKTQYVMNLNLEIAISDYCGLMLSKLTD